LKACPDVQEVVRIGEFEAERFVAADKSPAVELFSPYKEKVALFRKKRGKWVRLI
jgi:hypothetical protein